MMLARKEEVKDTQIPIRNVKSLGMNPMTRMLGVVIKHCGAINARRSMMGNEKEK